MSDKVVSIGTGVPINIHVEPDQGVIALLEQVLNAARAGTCQAVFVVGLNDDQSIASGWQGAHKGCFTLLGAIEATKIEYIGKEFQRRK